MEKNIDSNSEVEPLNDSERKTSIVGLKSQFHDAVETEDYVVVLNKLINAGILIKEIAVLAVEAVLEVRSKLEGEEKLVHLFDQMLSIIDKNELMAEEILRDCLIFDVIELFQRFPDAVLLKSLLSADFIQSSDVFKEGRPLGKMVDAIVKKDFEMKQGSEVASRDALEARKCFCLCVQVGLNIQSREEISQDGEDLERVQRQEVAPLEKCLRHKLYNEAKLLYETGLYSSRHLPTLFDLFLNVSEKKGNRSADTSEEKLKDLMSVILFQPRSLEFQCCVSAVRYSKDFKDQRQWFEELGVPHLMIDRIMFKDAIENYKAIVQKEDEARIHEEARIQREKDARADSIILTDTDLSDDSLL